MPSFKILICFLYFSSQLALFGQEVAFPLKFNLDSLKILKRTSETLIKSRNYSDGYTVFTKIAAYYFANSEYKMYFDYKNKALRCLSEYENPKIVGDSTFRLIMNFNETRINDTLLYSAIINNFLSILRIKDIDTAKLKYIDDIVNMVTPNLTKEIRIVIFRNRLEISKEQTQIPEQIYSIFQLFKLPISSKDRINFAIELGNLFLSLQEYQLSNVTLFNSLSLKSLTDLEKSKIFNLIGSNYLFLKKYSLALSFYKMSEAIRKDFKDNEAYMRVIYNNIANYYTLINKNDSARIFYDKALILSNSRYGTKSIESAFELNNLGNHFYNTGVYDSALNYYRRSFEIKQNIKDYNRVDIIHSLYNIGLSLSKLGNMSLAINFLKESLTKNFERNMLNSGKYGISSTSDYIFSCKTLGELYYELFTKMKDFSSLDSAKLYFDKAVMANDSIISSTPFESSKILFNLSNSKIIESYLRCLMMPDKKGNYVISDTSRAISLFDKSHNYILLKKLSQVDYHLNNRTLSSILTNDNSLDEKYNKIERFENRKPFCIDSLINTSHSLFSQIEKIEDASWHYDYQGKWQNWNTSINEIKEKMDNNTQILEYTVIKDSLFCLSLTQKTIAIFNISSSQLIDSLSNKIYRQIKTYSIDNKLLTYMSDLLLVPLKESQNGILKLIIIKDDNLIKIPFDILQFSSSIDRLPKKRYLIENYDISSSYSINLLMNSFDRDLSVKPYNFIGIAPISSLQENANKIGNLPSSLLEITCISKLFQKNNLPNKTFSGLDANLENFQSYSVQTDILHIATHSSSIREQEVGFFLSSTASDYPIKVVTYFDILNLPISPKLVVIASCSSYLGKLLEGEGIQNIGRAFAIKGALNIISSYFQLDDEFSSIFMSKFYSRLLHTNDVIGSLSNTKREFIKDKKYFYPTYWSNYNITGK